MGRNQQFEKEKLIVPVLISDEELLPAVKEKLEAGFGVIDYTSAPIPFTFTDYYHQEMGPHIKRLFLSFRRLIDPSRLASIKLRTNKIEKNFTVRGKRKVNLDPGILNLSRLILATTKDNAHRIPLEKGIFGEITLLYTRKDFRHLFWTYPDYRTEAYKKILRKIREIYRENLKQQGS